MTKKADMYLVKTNYGMSVTVNLSRDGKKTAPYGQATTLAMSSRPDMYHDKDRMFKCTGRTYGEVTKRRLASWYKAQEQGAGDEVTKVPLELFH